MHLDLSRRRNREAVLILQQLLLLAKFTFTFTFLIKQSSVLPRLGVFYSGTHSDHENFHLFLFCSCVCGIAPRKFLFVDVLKTLWCVWCFFFNILILRNLISEVARRLLSGSCSMTVMLVNTNGCERQVSWPILRRCAVCRCFPPRRRRRLRYGSCVNVPAP